MELVARAAGADDDPYDDVLEAGFSENEDGTGIAVVFQRTRSAPDPWPGDPGETELFNNTYCVTVGSGQAVYGGLKSIEFVTDRDAVIRIDPGFADILGLTEQLQVRFDVPESALDDFKAMLPKVVTWGLPGQVPALRGI
ncbi:hypothetical protein KDK95_17685 [Actinospica sp. MGRD01-02]|uniref:Uncharacterized protein n=1 Tax=Actinospica acidithermotolerans TaxID=2828514 RepID=A0A941ECX3_9ACTN|nr:Imm10 family immunity protein [Actinospica acidithermotolerans]MBR7828153.1 hypothetical protein [Actinospica acidithermotolerans]